MLREAGHHLRADRFDHVLDGASLAVRKAGDRDDATVVGAQVLELKK